MATMWALAIGWAAALSAVTWARGATLDPSRLPPAGAVSDGSNWWSLRPLTRPAVPSLLWEAARGGNPIDTFIAAKLAERDLRPSAEADRPTLMRRLYFDLVGLPPRPEEIEAFASDPNPLAYEKLVDRLLASPQYGERWARHWLDVVHYGETHGYDKDQPRPHAWPYRDYVIRAFNEDKPYTRFVQEQLAGDVLFPGTRDGFEGLGFIAAGPWDLIGHAEVPESKMDGKVARHLDRDDMVANTLETFNSLTVQCAQCHNHKFDPILQEDYYSLQAVFAAVDRADKRYDIDQAVAEKRRTLGEREAALAARRQELDEKILALGGPALADLDKRIAALEKGGKPGEAVGYHSNIEKKQDLAKWVQVDLGRPIVLGSVVLHPCQDDFNGIGEGFGFPVRFKVEVSDEAEFKSGVAVIGEFNREDVPNPRLHARSIEAGGRAVRFIRVTATKLAPRQDDYIFALAELDAVTAEGNNVALGAAVTALDSIEAPARWRKTNLTDGYYQGASLADTNQLAKLREQRSERVAAATSPDAKRLIGELEKERAGVKTALSDLPAQSVAYIGAVHHGSGAFAGRGAMGGKPRPIYILNRGSVEKPGQEVGPGALQVLSQLPARFDLPPNHGEGERRAALAKWLTDPRNPLTWRSMVNRIWQYHFGRGLVETPNDFGQMGTLPTHPELLDWLAVEFRDGGQSFKKLHQLIVTSATYRQSSAVGGSVIADQPQGAAPLRTPSLIADSPITNELLRASAVDPDNRYLWRMNRRKLEAEAIRDSILFVSGKLDLKMGGPSFQDFVVEKPEHSPHYEYRLHDAADPKSHRRSVYRFIVRSQQQPFMTALDCADPSMQVARRNESVSPLQALALLNNALMLTMSKDFGAKLERSEGALAAKVQRAYYEAIGRPPSRQDRDALVVYAREFGLANLGRVLFNLNEFAFVD